jgi:hypothetical protein
VNKIPGLSLPKENVLPFAASKKMQPAHLKESGQAESKEGSP